MVNTIYRVVVGLGLGLGQFVTGVVGVSNGVSSGRGVTELSDG